MPASIHPASIQATAVTSACQRAYLPNQYVAFTRNTLSGRSRRGPPGARRTDRPVHPCIDRERAGGDVPEYIARAGECRRCWIFHGSDILRAIRRPVVARRDLHEDIASWLDGDARTEAPASRSIEPDRITV